MKHRIRNTLFTTSFVILTLAVMLLSNLYITYTEENDKLSTTEDEKSPNINIVLSSQNSENPSGDNKWPAVGKKIYATIQTNDNTEYILDENFIFEWKIGDELIDNATGNSYSPSEDDFEKWISVNVYKKDSADEKQTILIGSDGLYFSKLPVVYIDTVDGENITEKTTYKKANITIQGNELYEQQYSGAMQIKGRGDSTWNLVKKPYKIKLDKKTDLYGFGKNKHYVLLANHIDECLMRNTVATDISAKLGLVNMQTTWVDVILNGEYIGNYQLCEHIRVGEDRVEVFDWENEAEDQAKKILNDEPTADKSKLENIMKTDFSWVTTGQVSVDNEKYNIPGFSEYDISGGYIFELSAKYNEISKFKTNNAMPVMINSPEYLNTNEEMFHYVQNYWQDFENAYLSEDGYNEKGQHYSEIADFDTMVGYWLTMEIVGNDDAVDKSRYAYKEKGGLLKFGPAWDFDWGCGSNKVGTLRSGWKVTGINSSGNFWKEWADDPYFQVKAAEKYWEIRDYLAEIVEDDGVIDKYYNYIKESGKADEILWAEKGRKVRGFEEDVEIYKNYLNERLEWLDSRFATTSTTTKALKIRYSKHPYTKSEDKLKITYLNAEKNADINKFISDAVLPSNTDLNLKIDVDDDNITKLSVYVNGIRFNQYDVQNGQVIVNISDEMLTEKDGKFNVVSLIGKDADNTTKYTNFTTVSILNKE